MRNPLKDATLEVTVILDTKVKPYKTFEIFEPKIKISNIIKGVIIGIVLFLISVILMVAYAVFFFIPPATV